MRELKYIIFSTKGMDKWAAKAVVFNGTISHLSIAQGLQREECEIHSAGFCVLNSTVDLEVVAYGRATSMEQDFNQSVCESHPEFDGDIIRKTLTRQHLI